MSAGSQRRLTVLVGALAAILVVLLARGLMGGDGADDRGSGAGARTTTSGGAGSTTAPSTVPPDAFNVNAVRDPFEPAIPIQTTASTTSGSSSTSSASTTSSSAATTTTTAPSNDPSDLAVSLLEVFVDTDGLTKATVKVATTVYDALTNGDTFGPSGSFQVVSLDVVSGCGQFLYADAPFGLCEGQQTLK